MPLMQLPEQLTPREAEQMRYEREGEEMQIEYGKFLKNKDIELLTLESKWKAWLRIPVLILKIPLVIILGLAYIVHAIRGIEPSDSFWNLLK